MDVEAIGGRYRREVRLGAGGMAEVWSAEDLELGRKVAIKLLGPGADRERFEREARAAASLSHPNICQLYDYGEAQGHPFIVLEYLPGGTLEDRLATGRPLGDEESTQIAAAIAAGLEHAHERGLVHRDLKPANILFDAEGRAKIADFGIARLGAGGTITEAGTMLGTAAYISPEQAAGEPATAASDVYAFGVILYRMLSGRLPFESENALELVRQHRDDPPPPLSSLRPSAPPVLESIAMAALAKSPADRPADGGALVRELDRDEPTGGLTPDDDARTTVLPFATRRPSTRPANRRRRLLLSSAVGLLLLGGGIALAFAATSDDPARPARPTSGPRATLRTTAAEVTTTGEAVSTRPQTTIASTVVATAPSVTTGRTTEPTTSRQTTEPVTTVRATTPATTQETFTDPITTEPTVPTEITTEPQTTTEPPPQTTEPSTTVAVTTEPAVP